MKDVQSLHTFGVKAYCRDLLILNHLDDLKELAELERQGLPWLVIGEGSNVLFVEDFQGTLVVNRLNGRQLVQHPQGWFIEAASGENWHQLVSWLIDRDVPGLENLALIPGSVGAAPVQNIGAYGAEFSQFCRWVEVWDASCEQFSVLTQAQCQFGYRDSLFKHVPRSSMVITRVGLQLPQAWQPNCQYGPLRELDDTATAQQIFELVCRTRRVKLPDPKQTGNAGSFFKNPIVSEAWLRHYQAQYPQLPFYSQPEGNYKIAAGWLIDQCGLKGYRQNGAGVHSHQALVLINESGTTSGLAIAQLAAHIQQQVHSRFAVTLEPEVLLIGRHGFMQSREKLSNYAKSS
ncbi:UDP-N-acetylmuramate dehydrogenase [Celerinatantimonas yamalensis]|uniref:UDP-N-acetylenolpyruvoylglucosamine reductase n=1 Tax=Celerinatantimonas yamalensis TaxID=559956 RepID=A0ABW9G754_9GAMM